MDKIKEFLAKHPELFAILAIGLAGFLAFETFYGSPVAGVALFGWVTYKHFKTFIQSALK